MSIVNISSENLKSGTDADFEINLKRSLHRVIGMQLLNATIPLTYHVVNDQNNKLNFHVVDAVGNEQNLTATLSTGTYQPDDLAIELGQQMNKALKFPPSINKIQRDMMIENRKVSFNIINSTNTYSADGTFPSRVTGIPLSLIEVGMVVKTAATFPNSWKTITTFNSTLLSGTNLNHRHNDTFTSYATNQDFTTAAFPQLEYEGIFVFFDSSKSSFYFTSLNYDIHLRGSDADEFANTRRMCKMLGIVDDNDADAKIPSLDEDLGLPNITVPSDIPELTGPGMLYLRIGGDILLDQQNSETSMNDRIPIPIDQDHGNIVHYENDAEADVIPFSVPCDVSNIKFRIEYGDDNEIVGGETLNLNGHHTYFRIKFFKEHQQSGIKM